MKNESDFLGLEPPKDIWEATNSLLILYKHVPSITSLPVYIGSIDKLLDPNIRYKIIKYRPVGVRTNMINSHTPSDEMMNKLGDITKKNGCSNVVLI